MGGHGAAYAHPDIVFMGGVDDRGDQPEHGRVTWIVQRSDTRIAPVGRHRVLDQIVRPDAEEVHFFRQLAGRQGGRRDLDHDSDRHRWADRHPGLQQFTPRLFKQLLGSSEFMYSRYHRKHYSDVSLHAGPEYGPQLHLEHFRPIEAEPDAPLPEGGIGFVRHLGGHLVRTQVQRAYDHGMGRHAPGDIEIGPGLLVFGRQFVAYQVQEFGTIQADAVRAVTQDVIQFIRQFDIGRKLDAPAVPRLRRHAMELLQLMLQHRQLRLRFLVPFDRFRIRIEMDQSAVAVDDDRHPVRDFPRGDVGAYHRGHGQAAGHDGRMGRLAAGVGDEAADRVPVDFRGIRRGQAVGNEHDLALHGLDPRVCAARELGQHPVMHVFEIGGPFAEERVLDRRVAGDPASHHIVEDILRVGLLPAYAHYGDVHDFRVFQHGLVGAKDLQDVLVDIHRDTLLQLGQVVQRLIDRGPEPDDLLLHHIGSNGTLVYVGEAAVIDECAADGDAGRSRNAIERAALFAHFTPPDPVRTSRLWPPAHPFHLGLQFRP